MTDANRIRRGRPRSEKARRAVLEATRDLVRVTGYERLTIDGIAERAGVGRQTVYRWWTSKASILADAVLEGLITIPTPAPPEGGDATTDIATWLRATLVSMTTEDNAGLVRALTAAAAGDAAESSALYESFTRPAHDDVVRMLAEGVATGAMRPDVDLDAAADALIGALLYRVLTRADTPASYSEALLKPLLAVPRALSLHDREESTGIG